MGCWLLPWSHSREQLHPPCQHFQPSSPLCCWLFISPDTAPGFLHKWQKAKPRTSRVILHFLLCVSIKHCLNQNEALEATHTRKTDVLPDHQFYYYLYFWDGFYKFPSRPQTRFPARSWMTLTFWCFLHFPNAGMTGVCLRAWLQSNVSFWFHCLSNRRHYCPNQKSLI